MITNNEQKDTNIFVAKIIAGVVGGLFLLTFILGTFYTVDAGYMAVQTRFGSIVGVSGPGLHGKIPFVDSVRKISVRTEVLDFNKSEKADHRMEAYSHDQQPAMMAVKLAFHAKADEKSIRQLYQQFLDTDGLANAVLAPRASQAVKTTFGQFTAVSVVQDREKFNSLAARAVQALIDQGVDGQPVPIVIDGVQVYDISFSPAYIHAVEARMQAQVEVEKANQNLERTKREAEMQVVQAEAMAKSTKLKGDAEASAIRARSDALRDSPKLVELTIAEKWNGVLPTSMVPGTAVPFLNIHGGGK